MIQLRLVWWVFWRGLLLGAIQGLLFGTVLALAYGLLFGVMIGALMGAVLGLINGVSLAFISRSYFGAPHDSAGYLKTIRQAAIPLDMLAVFGFSLLFVSFLAIIPTLIAAVDIYYLTPEFANYATSFWTPRLDQQPPATATSLTDKMNAFTWLSTNKPASYNGWVMLLVNLILVIAVAARIVSVTQEKPRLSNRYLIPAGYTGWVKVYYGVRDAKPFPTEGAYNVLVIPTDGELKTSSEVQYGWLSYDDYYTYQTDGTRSYLSKSGWGGGGLIWAESIAGDGSGSPYAMFFVGTQAQYEQQINDPYAPMTAASATPSATERE
jgi:hypothetical protein